MALILADRVKESTTTTGTSDFALGGAVTGFQTFAAGVGVSNTTYYAVSQGSDWEVGLGTLSSDGLTLARTTVLQSSNSDTKVSFASGSKEIFVTYAADKAVFEDASGNVTLPANLTVTGGSTTDSVQLDLTAGLTPAVGQIAWDAAQGTASLGLLGGNVISRMGQSLVAYVTNAESVTITKGQAVYLFSAQGDRATVKLANNTGDATSAKTLGIVAEDITANGTGFVVCQGVVYGLDLSAYTAGDTIYLGATAGTLTATKPYAPNHLVYMGVVEKANAGAGQIYVRVQNGYELDEIHNVSAQSPSNGQTIVYNSSTSLWEKNTVSLTAGVNGTLAVANGGTNASDAATARTNLAVAGTGVSNTFTANQIVSVADNTNAAVRITQTGTGNALLVEDAANPDSTPTVIDASGRVIIGNTISVGNGQQLQTVNADTAAYRASTTVAPSITLARARGTIASPTGMSANDSMGKIVFGGYSTNTAGYITDPLYTPYIGAVYTDDNAFGGIVGGYIALCPSDKDQGTNPSVNIKSQGLGGLVLLETNLLTLTSAYKEGVYTSNVSGTGTINLDNGTIQILTLTANWAPSAFPTAVAGRSFTMLLKQDATGGRVVTWPSSVKWPASTAPTITSTASKGDKFVFTCDGTYWWGSNAGQNYL